jgi:hypothetical protein
MEESEARGREGVWIWSLKRRRKKGLFEFTSKINIE